jgi:hypothetical protein
MTRRGLSGVALVAGLVLAACADTGATSTTAAPSTTVTTAAPTTTTTEPTTTTTRATTTTTEPPTTTEALPEFPPEQREGTHGGDAWVVVLAGSDDFEDPVFAAANEAAEAAGYHTGITDCDVGAPEALGLPDSTENGTVYTISVYLRSEADAHAALAAFQARGVEGVVALVQTYCMD